MTLITRVSKTKFKKGRDGIKQYWKDHNTKSLDGFETI